MGAPCPYPLDARRRTRGLVNRVAPQDHLEAATTELAQQLAAGPTLVLGLTKAAVVEGWEVPPETAYRFQGLAVHQSQRTQDFKVGVQALIEKRSPQFNGR